MPRGSSCSRTVLRLAGVLLNPSISEQLWPSSVVTCSNNFSLISSIHGNTKMHKLSIVLVIPTDSEDMGWIDRWMAAAKQ
ncbi:hypothetical protein BDQ94DRAFT_143201 [Aspergillus welwitschiae]|uniref:Uncharacterized protein n=1 Tax=Aspergillus welwitschiae TaxID=1341132 RepID=A0A3F3Q2T9_9EURO|nr:hypothetical protein BDQ94DRAFT_143201 [Aspergillus welwitschiae]RDH33493.1 hypothetical protein BDQ94DRAFT_143201 [Aspergillus welwitschiae]